MSILRFVFSTGLTCLLFIVIAVVALPNQAVKAQQPDLAIDDQRRGAAFRALIDRWQKTDDPGQDLAALDELQLKAWPEHFPLKGSRQQFRGTLQGALGDSYQQRRTGDRAGNLKKELAAYDVA